MQIYSVEFIYQACKCYSSEGKGFPNWECRISEGKVILAVRSQGKGQSHAAQQTSNKRLIGVDPRGWLPTFRG